MNSLTCGYAFDDILVITENPVIQQRDLGAALTEVHFPGPIYRPVVMVSYLFNEWLGFNPFGYHLLNVLLHTAASIAVFLLIAALLRPDPAAQISTPPTRLEDGTVAALVGALLFAVHPIHTEAVANIVGRAETLAALSVLVTAIAFLRFLDSPHRATGAYILSVAAFALGPFAKENALNALPILAVVHHWRRPDAALRERIRLLAPFAMAAGFYIVVRLLLTGAITYPERFAAIDNTLATAPWWVRIQTATAILWEYTTLLIAPVQLSADYSFDQIPLVHSIWDPRFLTAVLLFGLIGAVLFAFRRHAREVILGLLLALIAIALTSNIPFPIGTMKGERLLYLPSVGWCLAAGWLGAKAIRVRPNLWAPLLTLVIVLFAARTWARNYDWRDNTTLFEATVRTSPGSAKAHYNLGVAYMREDRLDEAMLQFRRTLQIYPDYADAAFGIGKIYEVRNVTAGAVAWYTRAIALNWEYHQAHLQLGRLRYELNEFATAEAAFRSGLAVAPGDPPLLLSLSAARLSQGAPWEAQSLLQAYDHSDWIDPEQRIELSRIRDSLTRAIYQ
jgi:tetratricopeptide (TPR) repeat protein